MADKKYDRKFIMGGNSKRKTMKLGLWGRESGDKTHVWVNASDDSKFKSLQELVVDGIIWLQIWHDEVP